MILLPIYLQELRGFDALLNTVTRFTFTSLGIAVLATFVQSRAPGHISDLLQHARPLSQAALALVRRQGLNLALQDAFWFSLIVLIPAFVAISLIRVPKPVSQGEKIPATKQAVEQVPGT
jgi:hypothetical protein